MDKNKDGFKDLETVKGVFEWMKKDLQERDCGQDLAEVDRKVAYINEIEQIMLALKWVYKFVRFKLVSKGEGMYEAEKWRKEENAKSECCPDGVNGYWKERIFIVKLKLEALVIIEL